MNRFHDARLIVLTLGSCAVLACASSGALSGPAPFPASHVVSRPLAPADDAPVAATPEVVVQSALSLRGTPYRFGGSTPTSGFDCSGFVAYVMAQHAIRLPRSVAEQFAAGAPVSWDRLRVGDLVFFSTIGPGATHVGLVTDANRAEFVHAPADGANVRLDRFDATYWRTRFVGARRVF